MALLVFLAVEPRQPHRRERLADLLWPDASPSEGRHSLATALSVIRGKLGPRTFESGRETVRLVAPELVVDLDRLARGQVLGDDLTPPLELGGFLDDFEVARAPEFVLWRELRRAQWFPAIRRAFVVLMDNCRRTGAFARIEPLADRLLALDELSEDAVRAKMEGRAFAGDRLSAIRIFQAWRQKLEQELGATPSPLVEGMALRLRQRSYEPPGTANVPTVPTDQWRDRAFVGRGSQYRAVYERWEQTAGGQGRHVLLLGDSGIGKTTLVERLVTAAGLEGAVHCRVQCYEVEREIPYAAVGTLVRGMLDRPGASGTAPEWLAELARSVPAVRERFPHLPPARESAGEAARLRLTEAVHQIASAVAEEHPLILVVDDVHLADNASVAVLHLLMRRTQEQRIMIVLTAREPELARSPNASRLLDVRRALALESVELPQLTEKEMGKVVSALAESAGRPLPPAVRRALLRASAGIPMVAELLFDDWRSHDDQCLALVVGAMTVDAQGEAGREVFRQVLERVFRQLTPVARAVLNLAAILGERLNDLSMYELVDLTLAQTLSGMSELTSLRILRDGGRELEFRNELLRGYAYLAVPSPLRRALHGLIADRLLAAEKKGEAIPGLMLAWHCYRAGRAEQAEPYLLKGSRHAIRRGGAFEVELALTSAMKNLLPEVKSEAQLLLSESLQEQGRWDESISVLSGVEACDATSKTKKKVMTLLAQSSLVADEDKAHACLAQLRKALEEEKDPFASARLLHASQWLVYFLEDHAEAEREFERAASIVRRVSDLGDRLLARTSYAVLAWLTRKTFLFPEILDSLNRLTFETEAAGISDSGLARLHSIRGCVLVSLGQYSQALTAYEAAYEISIGLGYEDRSGSVAENIALCQGRLGEYGALELWGERALSHGPSGGDTWKVTRIGNRIAWALAMRGDMKNALQRMEESSPPRPAGSRAWVAQADGLLRADILAACGEHQRAAAQATGTLRATGIAPRSCAYSGMVARWAAKTRDPRAPRNEAAALLERMAAELAAYDAIDQVEVLSARLWLLEQQGMDWTDGRVALRERLSKLPAAVEHQLRRLQAVT
jgi:DNA-binding SARP family transcriptional activator/tetratricopeptide (TPR) repeat protein/Cdc6-like AAA superfamily ATPase